MAPVVPPPKDAPDAHDEAERGTQDQDVLDSGSTTVSAPASLIGEKVVDEGKVKPPVVISSEVVPVGKAHTPSKPPAKKASKWTLWTLWFNTYRSVSTISESASRLVVFLILLLVPPR
jgi:hypothetical protein